MTDGLGRRLLAERQEEGLVDLLSALRSIVSQELDHKPTLGIPALDQRLTQTTTPPILEISSERNSSGKTQLLYQITAALVSPKTWNDEIELGGSEGVVVFIDCDRRLDLERFLEVLTRRTRRLVDNEDIVEDIVNHSLQHVYVFRPPSSASLIATLATLPQQLPVTSSYLPLKAVIIDSITAHYWSERARNNLTSSFIQITQHLSYLHKMFSTAIITTTNHTPTPLPLVYTNMVTTRVVLLRDKIAKFHGDMGWLEAWEEREMRQEVIDKAGFSGWVVDPKKYKREGGWMWFHADDLQNIE